MGLGALPNGVELDLAPGTEQGQVLVRLRNLTDAPVPVELPDGAAPVDPIEVPMAADDRGVGTTNEVPDQSTVVLAPAELRSWHVRAEQLATGTMAGCASSRT